MGTRGFVGFVAEDKETITYNHWDSYPSGVGLAVLEFARRASREAGTNFYRFKQAAATLNHVSDKVPPTLDEIEKLREYRDVRVSNQDLSDWYCLLRQTHGDPEAILSAGYAENAPEWPLDSLFCEWGYLIDFDNETFEVYEGFQKTPPTNGRWSGKSPTPRWEGDPVDYHAVRQVGVWPLSDLPDNDTFLALESEDDE